MDEAGTLEQLVRTWGYWAVLLGILLEGETILVLATLAAHRGYLSVDWVVAFAYAGAVLGDQAVFHLGRWRGERMLARWPRLADHVAHARRLTDRHTRWLGLLFRMTYGLRTALPLLWGMTGRMSAPRFLAIDAVAAALWVAVVVGLSWTLGQAVEHLLGEVARYETILFAAVVVVAVGVYLGRRFRRTPVVRPGPLD